MSNRGVSFRAALGAMRSTAERGVSAAIEDARRLAPLPSKMPASGQERGRAASALFDGILSALAYSIVDIATPGLERELAALCCEVLMAKVEARLGRPLS